MKKDGTGKLNAAWIIILIMLPVLIAAAALCIGRFSIPPREVFSALTGNGGEKLSAVEITVRNIRLPRVILALLVGAGLSAAGCAFQSLFANPLATPDTLGVASGASFGAALGLLLNQNIIGMQILSLGFGILSVVLTWLAGSGKGKGMSSVVLGGIMIGSLFNALISFVKFAADEESKLPYITYWLMGGLDKANFKSLAMGAPPIVLGILILYLLRWRMNLLPLSEDEIRSSGVNIRMLRGTVVLCATFMTASCVSMCGQVGWVGLLIPHMCRMKFGTNHLSLLPASVSLGAVFMVIVDTVARSLTAAEIPVSILTAIVGAPFFIVLMRRSGGWTF